MIPAQMAEKMADPPQILFYKTPVLCRIFLAGMWNNFDLHPDYRILRDQGENCDIEFFIGEEKMGAHRDKIEPSSFYFKNIIRQSVLQNNDSIVTIQIRIEPQVLEQILFFIYSEKILLNTRNFRVCEEEGMLGKFLKANEKYFIKNLTCECQKLIKIGTLGRPIELSVNHFAVNVEKKTIYHYVFEIEPPPPKTLFEYVLCYG